MGTHRFALLLFVTILPAACSDQQVQETARADSGVVTFNYQDTENDKKQNDRNVIEQTKAAVKIQKLQQEMIDIENRLKL